MTANHSRHSQNRSNAGSLSSTVNVVGVHFRVGRKIGEGSFGIIYEGTFFPSRSSDKDREIEWDCVCVCVCVCVPPLYPPTHVVKHNSIGTNLLNNQQVAIKFEPRKSDAPQLRDEYRTYKILSGLST